MNTLEALRTAIDHMVVDGHSMEDDEVNAAEDLLETLYESLVTIKLTLEN